MTSIAKPGMTINAFSYNGLDTRVGVTDSLGSRSFKRNGIGVTAPVLSDGLANYTEWRSEGQRSDDVHFLPVRTPKHPTGNREVGRFAEDQFRVIYITGSLNNAIGAVGLGIVGVRGQRPTEEVDDVAQLVEQALEAFGLGRDPVGN